MRAGHQDGHDGAIRTLGVQHNLLGAYLPHHNGHALATGVEGQYLENLVLPCGSRCGHADQDLVGTAIQQAAFIAIGSIHQGQLIGTLGFVKRPPIGGSVNCLRFG